MRQALFSENQTAMQQPIEPCEEPPCRPRAKCPSLQFPGLRRPLDQSLRPVIFAPESSYQPEGDGAYPPYSGSPGYGGHHSGDEPPKIGFALTLRQGPPATVSSVGGLWRSVALGGDRSAGAGTVQ